VGKIDDGGEILALIDPLHASDHALHGPYPALDRLDRQAQRKRRRRRGQMLDTLKSPARTVRNWNSPAGDRTVKRVSDGRRWRFTATTSASRRCCRPGAGRRGWAQVAVRVVVGVEHGYFGDARLVITGHQVAKRVAWPGDRPPGCRGCRGARG